MGSKKCFLAAGIAAAFLVMGIPLKADVNAVSVRVTAGADAPFYVDGQLFRGSAVFLWPATSKHFVGCSPYGDVTVATNLGSSYNPVTAHPDLKEITLPCTNMSCKVRVRWFKRGPESDPNTPSPGRVCGSGAITSGTGGTGGTGGASGTGGGNGTIVGGLDATGSCPDEDFDLACGTVTLAAYPNSGYIFRGWTQISGNPGQSQAYITTFTANSTVTVSPYFASASPLQVTIQTSPPNLKILADRAPLTSGTTVAWGWDTTHTLGAIPVQTDELGRLWVFDSWSDGGAINHNFVMPAGIVAGVTVTAKFVPGAVVTFLTDPPQLKLKVDNRENWPNYTFQWAAGTTHPVSAPLEQTDAKGRKYRFQGWSDGKAADYSYTVASAPSDARVTALYKAVGQITLSSAPAGMQVRVDGETCVTPCNIERDPGATVRISAPEVYAQNDASRVIFQGWSDGGSAEHDVTAPDVPLRLEAAYREQNRLTVSVDPSDAAVCRITPEAPDGFYDKGALVTLQVTSQPGSRFVGWAGDVSGTRPMAVVEVNVPKQVLARLEAVPYVQPSGVRNGAGETPVNAVAPGSIISILGVNLAPATEASPENPLAQTLAGVMVRMGDRMLPLVMVSPGEIRAQLPSDVEIGLQKLAVRWADKPEATAEFQVARNAPGMLFNEVEGRQFALGVRENGEPIAPGGSVHSGDIISVLGTGFGPYYRLPPDGFALPEAADFRLADPVDVVLGDAVVTPIYAGAATQTAGLNAVRFRVPELNEPGELAVIVRVNEAQSNTVLLRVE